MIKSMTGFGKGEALSKIGRFTVEIRTVNHRYFDLSSRIPNSLSQLEDKIKIYLHKRIKRGKVNFSISHKKNGKNLDYTKLDEEKVRSYYNMLSKLKNKLNLRENISLSHLLSFPDVIIQEQKDYNISTTWPIIEQAIDIALIGCNKMREKEGKAIYRDMENRVEKISRNVNAISRYIPATISRYKRKLDSRINDLLKGKNIPVDRARLETEIALFARQSDVSEEIVRAKSHLASLKNTFFSNQEVGRKLEFILQELQREINTLGSKVGYTKISDLVVDIKSEIEKIREQVQNVE
ncbi:MAG: YicC/YloC family endoribonuclease [Candidatus Omnitrophota bacterium]